jgi:hypothetical protein
MKEHKLEKKGMWSVVVRVPGLGLVVLEICLPEDEALQGAAISAQGPGISAAEPEKGVPLQPRADPGGCPKLSWDDVQAIRLLWSKGVTATALAGLFKVDGKTIWRAATGFSWKGKGPLQRVISPASAAARRANRKKEAAR